MKNKALVFAGLCTLALCASQVQAVNPFSRICNSGAVSISIFNAKKTILPCFSEKMLIFAAEKDLVAMRTTAIERGLQIPILGTSELQIRWNGVPVPNSLSSNKIVQIEKR